MSTAELKLDLINKIMKLKEVRIIEDIQKLLDHELNRNSKDWWDEISDAEKESIKKGIEQADSGKLNPHSKAREIYGKKI